MRPTANYVPTLEVEQRLWSTGYRYIAGVDEAGRGCLAGPVVAAAVIMPEGLRLRGIQDSKTLNAEARDAALLEIQHHALGIGIGQCTPVEIDEMNILWAAMEAMRRAVSNLILPMPDYVLIDGNRSFPECIWPFETMVKGDRRSHSIAAASIVAKVTRDRLMIRLHNRYPMYGWADHKGYPTASHYAALAAHGPSPHHRRSFRLE
jgi:ribonuclease HII